MREYNRAELKSLAAQLSLSAKTGDIFLLHGDLGAGKTTFAQAFVQAQYPDVTVTSPTFSICHEYEDIVHYDLYRINTLEEFNSLDIQEHFYHRICLIEWPEILGPLTPKTAIHIYIKQGTSIDKRSVSVARIDVRIS